MSDEDEQVGTTAPETRHYESGEVNKLSEGTAQEETNELLMKYRSRDESEDKDSDESAELEKETLSVALLNLMVNFHWPEGSSITIERVESTKAAVAELTATAIQSSTNDYSANSLQDLALLQSTIVTLQQQQIIQLQLVQQLLAQIAMCTSEIESVPESSEPGSPVGSPGPQDVLENGEAPKIKRELKSPSSSPLKSLSSKGSSQKNESPPSDKRATPPAGSGNGEALSAKFASVLNCTNLDPNRPLSPGLASFSDFSSSFANTGNSGSEGVNTLEMLQRRAQEVLDSASQGLLASSLADDPQYKKDGMGADKREPFFKHRCRYCGKVFGSDSALQIHIRSHTGERPYKCNICGSRFTTKGNLKVHFQRHTAKFPHIKMNPHPVPEHLDHFHPPLLASGQRSPDLVPSLPFGPLQPFQPMNFMRFDEKGAAASVAAAAAASQFGLAGAIRPTRDLPEPEDLSSSKTSDKNSPGKLADKRLDKRSVLENMSDDESGSDADDKLIGSGDRRLKRETENDTNNEYYEDTKSECEDKPNRRELRSKQEKPREGRPRPNYSELEEDDDFDDDRTSIDKNENDELMAEKLRNIRDQPENLSSKTFPLMYSLPLQTGRPTRPSSASRAKSFRPEVQSPSSSVDSLASGRGHGSMPSMPQFPDPLEFAKDPRSYAALLPRPGSASSAWESLIEVNTSSETSKLQQLVDNIDHQTSDPNECVVCHRVLSCKSALQMHYRTHTGERPFKCRLCGRAFTTKGNLKTHMGVHRIKEGDAHHQCPVCHKRFTTQLVLQQHIRLHTGEPTELTLDQIRAGEIRDLLPNFGSVPPSLAFLQQTSSSTSSVKDESRGPTPNPVVTENKFPTSIGSLENQVRAITASAGSRGIFPEDLSKKCVTSSVSSNLTTTAPSAASRASVRSPATTDSELSSSEWAKHSESEISTPPSSAGPTQPFLPLDLTPKNNIFPPFIPGLNSLMGNSALNSLANSVLNSTAGFNPVHMGVMAGRAAGAGRGNTTCNICFKTFACNSALEIHYRSHTKERPFKCNICERGFSTKGNMKQHMLTHKIRDMPNSGYDASKLKSSLSVSSNENSMSDSHHQDSSPSKEPEDSLNKSIKDDSNPPSESESEARAKKRITEMDVGKPAFPLITSSPSQRPSAAATHHGEESEDHMHVSASSNGSKHVCSHCHKSFSSSSALHIHMRTHTGDKPFKCSVCQKAFTTKGNLKVHMGTHMWTSGASRRGRRMSLELPLGLQFQPPTGDRLDGRSFFPFVPPNFPGGPVNLAASKFCDYSMFRPPIQMTQGHPSQLGTSIRPPLGPGISPDGSSAQPRNKRDDDDDEADDADEELNSSKDDTEADPQKDA